MELPGDIRGQEPALAPARDRIPGHRVDHHGRAGREGWVVALSTHARHCPGEHIAHTGTRHAGIAALAQSRRA
jgi:hypothetical protein